MTASGVSTTASRTDETGPVVASGSEFASLASALGPTATVVSPPVGTTIEVWTSASPLTPEAPSEAVAVAVTGGRPGACKITVGVAVAGAIGGGATGVSDGSGTAGVATGGGADSTGVGASIGAAFDGAGAGRTACVAAVSVGPAAAVDDGPAMGVAGRGESSMAVEGASAALVSVTAIEEGSDGAPRRLVLLSRLAELTGLASTAGSGIPSPGRPFAMPGAVKASAMAGSAARIARLSPVPRCGQGT